MDNQHRMIKGYKELDETKIKIGNEIKTLGMEIEQLVDKLEHLGKDDFENRHLLCEEEWLKEGKMYLKKGLMFLTRSVFKPDFF